jgi:glucose/arabinose dehydrogenase
VERGGNYGWNLREGAHCFNTTTCSSTGLSDPIAEYSHAEGCSVTGGYVYRGMAIPALQGVYLYGDFCSGRLWGLACDATNTPRAQVLQDTGIAISSFAEGYDGEVYVLDYGGGGLYRVSP